MLSALIAMSLLVPKPILAGYLPAWRTAKYDFSRLAPLTDVLYFSIQPTVEGGLNLKDINMADLPKLGEAKKKYGFRLLICAGGWERGEGFVPTASDRNKTDRFVRESLEFCDKHGFDGIDLDWEHPKTPEEGKLYGDLIQALRTAFAPRKKIVTAAIAAWQTMSPTAVHGLDRVHLMSYDHPERHSTMDKSVEDVKKLRAMGFPSEKIILGVPFYGRSLKEWNEAKSYSELLPLKPKPEDDEVGGFYFNGPKTLAAKAALVKKEKLGGIMIWEVTQDVSGDRSLLAALKNGLKP